MTTPIVVRPEVYPDAQADAERAAAAGFDPDVTLRLLNYVAALNLHDQSRNIGGPFPRHAYYRLADPVGRQRYLRVVDVQAIGGPGQPIRSAVAFVEIGTGLVYKPDGWKRPAKGPRGSLATDEAMVELVGRAGLPYALYARP